MKLRLYREHLARELEQLPDFRVQEIQSYVLTTAILTRRIDDRLGERLKSERVQPRFGRALDFRQLVDLLIHYCRFDPSSYSTIFADSEVPAAEFYFRVYSNQAKNKHDAGSLLSIRLADYFAIVEKIASDDFFVLRHLLPATITRLRRASSSVPIDSDNLGEVVNSVDDIVWLSRHMIDTTNPCLRCVPLQASDLKFRHRGPGPMDLDEYLVDPAIIGELSEQLFRTLGGYVLVFGKGIASSCPDPQALWTRVVEHLERAGDSARHCQLLQGILEIIHQRDASLAERILDEAVQTRSLRNFFVWLQLSVPLNPRAVQRLLDCLDFDDTPRFQFGQIAWYGSPDVLKETGLAQILLKLLDRPDGAEIVLDGLNTRAPVPETETQFSFGEDLSRVGLLAAARYLRSYDGYGGADKDNGIRRVLNCSMNNASLTPEIDDLFQAFFVAIRTSYGYIGDLEETTQALIAKAPHTFLDRVFLGDELDDDERAGLFAERHWEGNILSGLHPSILLDWCSQGEFRARLALISEAIYPLTKGSENGDIELSDQARALLDASPDASQTLTHFARSVHPSGSSGSLANIIARRRRPFELLLCHEREDVRTTAAKLVPQIRDAAERERERERAEDQERDQRFE